MLRHIGLILACIGGLTACTLEQHYAPPPASIVQLKHHSHTFLFEKDAIAPLPEDSVALRNFTQSISPNAIQSVTLYGGTGSHAVKSQSDALLKERTQSIRNLLLDLGYPPHRITITEAATANPQQLTSSNLTTTQPVTIELTWYSVTPPECKPWSADSSDGYAFTKKGYFGCTTNNNLGKMIADPRDMLRGKDLGPADAITPANAVMIYRASSASGGEEGGSE